MPLAISDVRRIDRAPIVGSFVLHTCEGQVAAKLANLEHGVRADRPANLPLYEHSTAPLGSVSASPLSPTLSGGLLRPI